LKAKRTSKTKTPSRKEKGRTIRVKKAENPPAKSKKPAIALTKKISDKTSKESRNYEAKTKTGQSDPRNMEPSPYSALNDAFSLASAWDVLGDEEYILDDEVWNTLYNRIKLQLLQTSYSFRVEVDGLNLSPYASTPMPAFRADNEPGYLNAGSFTILRPELPGVVFDLKISANDVGLILDWQLKRKDETNSAGHVALYLDGELVEAVNLRQNHCKLEITRDDVGDATFYFLDSDSGKQTKILELNI
jgi:hypothetical protein